MLTARQLYFEAVKVGDELPPLVKPPIDRLQIARYAGAAQDWNPLSVDEQHARNSGFPSALVPAMVSMGFLGELVTDWVRGARLRKFQARFVKIVWPGDVLTARGRVVDRRFEAPGQYAIDIETWAENQRGEKVVGGIATFQLYYSAEDESRQRAGQPPLLVTREEEEARLAKLSRAQPARPAPPQSRPLAPPKPAPAPPAPRPAEARPLASVPPPLARPPEARPAAAVSRPAARPEAKLAARAPAPVSHPAARPEAKSAVRAPDPVSRPATRPEAKSGARAPAPRTSAARPPAHPHTARPVRSAAKRGGAAKAKAKVARPHAAKRPAHNEKAARARSGGAAKKPSGKKRR